MKKICLTITVAVFLLFFLNVVQAQTTETKPNQVELVKKLIGKWQAEWTDTINNLTCVDLSNVVPQKDWHTKGPYTRNNIIRVVFSLISAVIVDILAPT